MDSINLYIFLAIIAPLTMMLFVFKGKSKIILTFAMIGIYFYLLAGEINALILNQAHFDYLYLTQNISPIIEEILKAIPIFVFVFAFKPNRQFAIECAISIGIGFALMENICLLCSEGTQINLLLALFRGFGAGMMHGISTLIVGLGALIVSNRLRIIVPGTLAALSTACIYHSIYNTIVGSQYQTFGILFPLCTFVILFLILKYRFKFWTKQV